MAASSDSNNMQDEIHKLITKKEEIERDIKELNDVLLSQGGVGIDGPLLDADQFPRNDIDIYTVRHARHQIACLQTDHKEIMKQIEENLHSLHEKTRHQHGSSSSKKELMDVDVDQGASALESQQPFALIDKVDQFSPADTAGVQVGDEIVAFGSVNINNFHNLQDVGTVVQHSKGRSISVVILRNKRLMRLSVTPNTWSGRGLLGCNIVPMKK